MLVRGGAGEEPPFSVEKKDRRIGLDAGNDVLDANPLVRKRGGTIKADSASAERLGDHIEVTVPAKDIWIGKMKRLAQNDLSVLPSEAVAAHGEADFAQIVAAVHHLEKHVPEAIDAEHEGISNEVSGHVSDVAGGDHRIVCAGGRRKPQRRFAGVNADRPDPRLAVMAGFSGRFRLS